MVFFYPTSRSYIFSIPPPFHKSNPNDNQKMSTTKYKLKYSINTISSHYTLYKKHITWYNWNWLTERKSSNRPGFGVPSTQLLFHGKYIKALLIATTFLWLFLKYSYSQNFASQAQPFHKEHHLLRINTHNTQHLNTSNNKKGDQHNTNKFLTQSN